MPGKDPEIEDVRKFYKKFDFIINESPTHLTSRKLQERVEFIAEELREFVTASRNQDLAGQADALIDIVYVVKGTAIMMGLPWVDLWDDVQRANMTKVRGVTHRGHAVDAKKPEGWQGPKTREILINAGYDPISGQWVENHADD